jgi:hypothetical protein
MKLIFHLDQQQANYYHTAGARVSTGNTSPRVPISLLVWRWKGGVLILKHRPSSDGLL